MSDAWKQSCAKVTPKDYHAQGFDNTEAAFDMHNSIAAIKH